MLRDIWVFAVAVISHWAAYLTGGVVTALVVAIERLTDWKMSKKWFVIIFCGVFILVSFFLTWREEFQRANGLQVKLNQQPTQPQVQVNVPQAPPTTVIVQTTHGDSELPDFLQLQTVEFSKELDIVAENRKVGLNFIYKNGGKHPIRNRLYYEQIGVISGEGDLGFTKPEKVFRARFDRDRKEALHQDSKSSAQNTNEIGVDQIVYRSVQSTPLSAAQVLGITTGTTRIYAITWVTWKDVKGRPGSLSSCRWLQSPQSQQLVNNLLVWHSCDEH